MANKVVIVTGASSGIGQATAIKLGGEGHQVVLAARRTDRLNDVAEKINADGGTAVARAVDVTDRDDVARLVDDAVSEFGRVDVFVNNAGVMPLSRLDALLVDEWNQMIDVNVRGLLHAIASIGAHEVVPTGAVYCASKYAAWAITEGLRLESDPSIRVTTISPGVVESELADSISDPTAQEAMRTYRAISIPADAIAAAISYAIGQPPDVDVNEIIVRPAGQR
jgi:NADP-dependent 3-hydroxy acid dehydrogenase YdfG